MSFETLLPLLPIVLLGALIGIDVVTFPQAMLSRPIVAATAAGALLGFPEAGLLIGVVLELIAMEVLPFGASRYPEWGTAGVVGGALYASHSGASGALPVACAGALLTALVSGQSMTIVRRLNARRVKVLRDRVEAGSGNAVTGIQVRGLTLDMARGAIVTFAALIVLGPATDLVTTTWIGDVAVSSAVMVAIAASVGVSAIWRVFHGASHAPWLFLIGLCAGSALLVLK
jgi:mannose/fructose/N-acetylgalactosamine-specific phosphotransferase system component IIC